MSDGLASALRTYLHGRIDCASAVGDVQEANLTGPQFDTTLRGLLLEICGNSEENVVGVQRLLELVLACSDKGLGGSEFALSLLEEAMDLQTIGGCDTLFAFLENHRTKMTAKMGKGQVVLRLCNELLRRLSKTEDTVFCGRILIFLSLVFPLSERSAVNHRGDFNTENITAYEMDQEDKPAEQDMQIDGREKAEGLGGISPDAIYTTFWSLQTFFNYPPQLLSAPVVLSQFKDKLTTVISAFETIQEALPKQDSSKNAEIVPSVGNDAAGMTQVLGYFTPKVLTSKKLLKLELADSSFRRHICVQMLIVLDYLLALTAQSKEKWSSTRPVTNKSLLLAYTLSVTDAEWVAELRARVTALLRFGKDGPEFLNIVNSLLQRDQAWLRWKCDSCPSYDLPPLEDSRIAEAPKRLASLVAPRKPYMYNVGNAVLSKLWSSAGGWSKEELENCTLLPTPESYTAPIAAIERELEDTLQEDEIHILEDQKASKSWRALRVARLTDIDNFTEQVAGGNLAQYLNVKQHKADGGLPKNSVAITESTSVKRPASDSSSEPLQEKRQKLMSETTAIA